MSKAKHTPGPWAWVGSGLESNEPATILDCGEFTAARPSEADARLIEAAPDMLAEIERQIKYHYNPFEPDNQGETYKSLKALHARATGSTS